MSENNNGNSSNNSGRVVEMFTRTIEYVPNTKPPIGNNNNNNNDKKE